MLLEQNIFHCGYMRLWSVSASSLEDEEEGAVGGVKKDEQTLKHWFKKLKELRAEVEKIRKMICNKYAEDMGDNLNCATQWSTIFDSL